MKNRDDFIYQKIAESLRRRIASGEFQPGDKLPSVREMAQHWACTPGTVSRAYTQLGEEGLVTGHRGGGTRVTSSALHPEHPVWGWANLVNRAEQFLLEAIGGGHTPTQAESALSVAISRWRDLQRRSLTQIQSEPAERNAPFRFVGSHDLTVELMARMLHEESADAQLSIEYVGSLGGLMALARNEADVAGSHLWDETTDTYNRPFVQRLLPGRRAALLTLAHRSLGLITAPGNPMKLQGLADLDQSEVLLVNRQPGSGTRVWLDARLRALSIAPKSLPGYEHEEITHLAVARIIAEGKATAGLGIYAAAAAYSLDFVPLTQERYDLVFSEERWNTPVAQTLVRVVRSARFKEAIGALGGYDTAETGQEMWTS
jgi:molybdate-binding protein/DNA-binding transcriptional regulator YhcF (GntR family)